MSYIHLKGRIDRDFDYNVSGALSNAQIHELVAAVADAEDIVDRNTRPLHLMSYAVIVCDKGKLPRFKLVNPTTS